jgi:MYXO-CTERM domain-containing protein
MAARKDDERLDEALEETFPASDPVAPVQPGSVGSQSLPAEVRDSVRAAGPKLAMLALGVLIGYFVRRRR